MIELPKGQNLTLAEMIGELLREAAVLVGVFAPLESAITKQNLTFSQIALIVAVVVALAAAGIAVEVKRA